MKNKFGDFIIQIITVMIGVFLGFAVSNWSESEKEEAQTQTLLTNIATEIRDNQQRITKRIDYPRMLRDTTRHYLREENLTDYKPSFFRGLNTISFLNSAFETGVQTGLINDLSIDKLQTLNTTYRQQRSYDEFANIILSGMFSLDFEPSEKATRRILLFLSISMTDIVIKEEQLLESYEKALSLLEE
ncbi:MAG: hypothetical protein HKM28_04855 [Flavobacteriaceae bacterium]|nr:hypothetical protein [Flavobacteriaceae bacterium]